MSISVLIVDDEEQSVKTLKNNVAWEKHGVEKIYEAYNAKEAKIILKDEKIDIILCDIEMPGENGLELIQWVRDEVDLNDESIECIILTCHPEYEFMRKAIQIGCRDYLIKPLDEEEFEEILKKTISKAEKRKDEKDIIEYEIFEEKNEIIHEKVIPYIKNHYKETITIEQIAKDAALNPQYLMRLFKKEMGESILECVTKYRLSYARELLEKTNWNNEIISEKVGYASSNYFIKLFKKQFGLTPREFRKKSLLNR